MTGILGAVMIGRGTIAGGVSGIALTTRSISAQTTVSYSVNSDGTVRNKNSAILETWNSSGNPASAYQVRATLNSGTIAGTFGSWTSLASTQTWTNNTPASGSMLVEIRDVATSTVRASAIIGLTALDGTGGGGGGGGGIIP